MTDSDSRRASSRGGFRNVLAGVLRGVCAVIALGLSAAVLLLLLGAEGDLAIWDAVSHGADAVSLAPFEGLAPAVAFVDDELGEPTARWGASALVWLSAGVLLGAIVGTRGGRRSA